MKTAVTVVQNVPYVFTLERAEGRDPVINFYDFEVRDILLHVKYRVEARQVIANSYLLGQWQKQQEREFKGSAGARFEIRFASYRVWLRFAEHQVELQLPFPAVAERIGLLQSDGFNEPANLLQADFMAAPVLRQGMSSIEYAIVDARLRRIEEHLLRQGGGAPDAEMPGHLGGDGDGTGATLAASREH